MKSLILAIATVLSFSACSFTGKQPSNISAHISDMEVTTKVKTTLQSDNELKPFNIAVVTTKGDVRLTGTVESQAQKDRATQIARSMDGAHTLHDELMIKES
ncbi:MAG: BON domain-containing protein [Iodobacter sp.]